MQRLTTIDASFLYGESASGPMHISSISVVEGELSFEEVFEHFASRMHLLPTYRRKLAQVPLNIAHPTWVDDPDFDLANHVLHKPLAEGTSLEEAIATAVTINEQILDRSRPLWRAWVITGVAGHTLILHETHHAMIDGASGIELLAIVYDFEPEAAPVTPPEEPWVPEATPSPAERFRDALADNLKAVQPGRMRSLLRLPSQQSSLLRRAGRVLSEFLSRPVITTPFNAGLVGPHRELAWIKHDFGEIREIRRALGGTINDVVLTMVSEAIARYLIAHGEAVEDQQLRIMCPVNVRTENQKGALGNQVSAIFPVLPAWPMPAAERLAAVCAETARIKNNEEAQALTMLQESIPEPWPVAAWPSQLVGTGLDPTAFAARLPHPQLPKGLRPPNVGINFVCTNVPGAQVPQYLCGHKVLDQVGLLVLTGNIGFGVVIMSYNQQLYFGFICDPTLMPDVALVAEGAEATFAELLAMARQRTEALQAAG